MLGLAIGAAMCYPGIQLSALSAGAEAVTTVLEGTLFQSPVYIDFFGIPVISVDYTGTVIPVILTVWFASKCEKLFNRFVPDLVKFFFVPMLTLLVTLPVAMIFLGPVATFGSTLISEFTLMIREFSPLLAGAVVGFTWQILVIFGMHWGFIPVYINNVQTLGYDNVMMPFFACTFATSAVVLAMFFKTKDKKIKEMAIPNFISGIFGVTEPAIYGMLLPLKKPFIISCIAGGIGGAFQAVSWSYNMPGIATLPAYFKAGHMTQFIGLVISILVSFVLGALLTYLVGFKEEITELKENEPETKLTEGTVEVASPVSGKVIPVSKVNDEAFASEMMGKGVGIIPNDGKVYAPFDGTISALFDTNHAVGLTGENGLETLIHIGIDTVKLDGKGFEVHTKTDASVKKGDLLVEFDKELLEKEGFDTTVIFIVVNMDQVKDMKIEDEKTVKALESVMEVTC